MQKQCFICNSNKFYYSDKDYIKCKECGHGILRNASQKYIINEELKILKINKDTFLDKFKNKILRQNSFKNKTQIWVDIGSSSGKYLYRNKKFFRKSYGIEVTKQCYDFSKNDLKLNIYKNIKNIKHKKIDILTAWHSLEHIPEKELINILKVVNSKTVKNSKFIISVPNDASFQKKLFGKNYVYEDVPNHTQNFTLKSLRLLLKKNGFTESKIYFSFPYNIFGYFQGYLNILQNNKNYIYYRFKRNSEKKNRIRDLANFFLALFIIPISALSLIIDYLAINDQAVLTIVFKKN